MKFYLYSMLDPGRFLVSELADAMVIRVTLLMSLLGLLFVAINTFRYYLNRQGKMSQELNKNSYGVYIIHVIVLGSIAFALLYTTIPSLLKCLLLAVSTYAASNLIVYFYRMAIKPKIIF
jgi:fucose 4-O-acetylase-like acetyltransferase